MRHYAHHIGDYRAHTAHLSFVEDAAYRRLLDLYYMSERALPPEIPAVQRLCGARTEEERQAVEVVLREFFSLCDDGWHQARADKEIADYHAKAEAARENGKLGGRPKTTHAKPTKNQGGLPSVPQGEPAKKLTMNQEPSSVSNDTDADPASVVFRQGLAWLMKATGKSETNCRSQLGKWRKAVGDEALIAVLGRGQREAPIDAMEWMEKAVAAHGKNGGRKPWEKLPADTLPAAEPWEQRMRGWRESRQWIRQVYGPPPGEPGCRVPTHLIGGTA